MKLEHRSQQLASIPHFLMRTARYGAFAIVLTVLSVSIGTVGYHQLAGLAWIDSFHMACMILTGMGPIVEMTTTEAKLFSSFYALYSGVAFLTLSALLLTPLVHRLFHILHIDQSAREV